MKDEREERGLLERYQRYLLFYRKKNDDRLTFRSQQARTVPLPGRFCWMTRQNHILHNPASEIDLPRLGAGCQETSSRKSSR